MYIFCWDSNVEKRQNEKQGQETATISGCLQSVTSDEMKVYQWVYDGKTEYHYLYDHTSSYDMRPNHVGLVAYKHNNFIILWRPTALGLDPRGDCLMNVRYETLLKSENLRSHTVLWKYKWKPVQKTHVTPGELPRRLHINFQYRNSERQIIMRDDSPKSYVYQSKAQYTEN